MTDDDRLVVRNDEKGRRYEAWLGADLAGVLTYDEAGGRVVLTHTGVLPEFQHRGVASRLIAEALDEVRSTGRTVTVVCPAVRGFLDGHPGYTDVVDPVHPGIGSEHRPQ